MTITHPEHPLRGQGVEIVRLRRGVEPQLIVRSPDDLHLALAVDWTDYATRHADAPAVPPLLAIDGLRRLAQLIAQFQHEGRPPVSR